MRRWLLISSAAAFIVLVGCVNPATQAKERQAAIEARVKRENAEEAELKGLIAKFKCVYVTRSSLPYDFTFIDKDSVENSKRADGLWWYAFNPKDGQQIMVRAWSGSSYNTHNEWDTIEASIYVHGKLWKTEKKKGINAENAQIWGTWDS